jgi:hypothetical protein
MALSKRAASEVGNAFTNVVAQMQNSTEANQTIHSKAGLSRWSAVVRGAVDTGCRRNYHVAVSTGK